MSAEAAFLEVLKANPADDTTRLVYADWLDEHDRAPEAEYLRLIVALAHAETDHTRDRHDVRRLLQISESLPGEWRTAAASRFKVVFYGSCESGKKIATIKAIRVVSKTGLAEAKTACEVPPSELLREVPFEVALAARDHVREHSGGTVLLHPCERTDLPLRVVYDIVASRWYWNGSDDSELPERVTLAFAEFLRTALGISLDEARELARDQQVTLARNVEADSAKARVAELSRLAPSYYGADDYEPLWQVWVTMIPTAVRKPDAT
jgi:uncharacterized protein (TIGR02996 family)